jgi:hypothetical protein
MGRSSDLDRRTDDSRMSLFGVSTTGQLVAYLARALQREWYAIYEVGNGEGRIHANSSRQRDGVRLVSSG